MPAADEVRTRIAERITAVSEHYRELMGKLRLGKFGGIVTADDYAEFNGMCLAVIDQATGRHSAIYEQAIREIERFDLTSSALAASLYGLVSALKRDIDAGALSTLREAERADVLADLIQMAMGLLAEEQTDAAATVFGLVLVTHLRNVGIKQGMQVPDANATDKAAHAALEVLNADLVGIAYGKLVHQGVSSGLQLWYDATHGATADYAAPKLSLYLDWLRAFVTKYPA
jgi:hypothetical protein